MKLEKANAIVTAIDGAHAAIGTSDATAMPRSKGNQEPRAWELFVAQSLKRLSEARLRRAEKAARESGLIFDPEKEQRPVGTNAVLHDGDVVKIGLEVSEPQTRLDIDAFISGIEKLGVPRPKIDKLRTSCTKPNRPPHKFTAALATT